MARYCSRRVAGELVLAVWLLLLLLLLLCTCVLAAEEEEDLKVYMVIVRGTPVVHYNGDVNGYPATATSDRINALSENVQNYASHLIGQHDMLLEKALARKSYQKLYSYHHLINGFAVQITHEQAGILRSTPEVLHVEEDERVRTMTTHTPDYLGLPKGCWPQLGGVENAGDGVVIGIVDTGIDPSHPSFLDGYSSKAYTRSSKFSGKCEVAAEFPKGSCSGKLVGAQHFAAAALASGEFNASMHFASPLDGDGHGTHTAATAAGNNGVPVKLNGYNFGSSSGMAPRAQIAVYKALYRYIGGFFADVVAAIDQAVADGVDVLSLSVGPNGLPRRNLTFMSTFDMALLSAVKAGVFVTQAVGNGGPYPKTILSFSPWILSVAAAMHDRTYPNSITLGSNITISGTSLAPGSEGMFTLITADDALIGNASRSSTEGDSEECQNAESYDIALVQGKILVCSYSLRFLFGVSTVKKVVTTAQSLKAKGIVLVTTPDLDGHNFQPIPVGFPAIIIPTFNDSTVLLQYYNTSTMRNEAGKMINSGATASIAGGEQASFSYSAPRVATYSSRGPDVNSINLDVADVLKPNILAPGNLIWAAWTPIGTDEREFNGEKFAMISGTSMATPHVAGIAALVKQRNPTFSPAAIASAIATTALTVDANGNPLLAQHPSSTVNSALGPATPFDFGAGFVNPGAAIDPGLVFDAGYEDYVRFLCSVSSSTNSSGYDATGSTCSSSNATTSFASDLNMPYISIGSLNGVRTVVRTATSVAAAAETYTGSLTTPAGVSIAMSPRQFPLQSGESMKITLTIKAIVTATSPTFGQLVLEGDKGHRVRLPIIVSSKTSGS